MYKSLFTVYYLVTTLKKVQEWFGNREDKLTMRLHEGGVVTEDFVEGRQRSLKQHVYKANFPGSETDRTMTFYDNARYNYCKSGSQWRVYHTF